MSTPPQLQVGNFRLHSTYNDLSAEAEAVVAAEGLPSYEIRNYGVVITGHSPASNLVGENDWKKVEGWSVWIPLPRRPTKY